MTPQELAKAYVDTITGQANGGASTSTQRWVSRMILSRLHREAGKEEGDRLLQIEFDVYHAAHKEFPNGKA